jgi:hypothetical protein
VDIFQIDDVGQLYISPAIDDWASVVPYRIDTVIDLEGGIDTCIPTDFDACLYVYFPIEDDDEKLPPVARLRAVAQMAATLIREGHRVLSHCGMGFNRSALMAGLILVELGMPGARAVERLRERRPGALYNDNFATFLETLDGSNLERLAGA